MCIRDRFIIIKDSPFFSKTASLLLRATNFTPGLNSSNIPKVITFPLELIKDTKPSSFSEVITAANLNLYKLISFLASSGLLTKREELPPVKLLSPTKGSFKGSGSSLLISDAMFACEFACFSFTF